MMLRWLIRSLFIAFAVICVVVWASSYWRGVDFVFSGNSHNLMGYGHGRAYLLSIKNSAPQPFYWDIRVQNTSGPTDWRMENREADYAFFGFSFLHRSQWSFITIPLYFPTLLSALLLWLVWRKTRAKPIGGAFPVEPTAKSGVKQV